jgi:predicted RNA-binding Zn-ribbon protein involved in translation (DUF1610 family)
MQSNLPRSAQKQFDLNAPTNERNMFGLLPCPKCGDEFCWPTQAVHPTQPSQVVCDACGWSEPIRNGKLVNEELK